MGEKPDSDHKGKEEKKKKRLIIFLLGIFCLFLKDFRVAVFFLILKLNGIEIECQSWKLTKNA